MLKKLYIPCLLLISLYSCREEEKEFAYFTSVDITWSNGWNKRISVHVDSLKSVRIEEESYKHKTIYYRGIILDSSFTKLNSFIRKAFQVRYDSVLGETFLDGTSTSILVQSKQSAINSLVFPDVESGWLDSLTILLINYKNYKLKTDQDSSFEFESKKRAVLPPALEPIIFVPPIIKENETEEGKK